MWRFMSNAILSASLLVVSLFVAWMILSQQAFFYGSIYDYNDLGSHISKYAPQNRNKDDFELTDRQEHVRLFSEISFAINGDPSRLREISYQANGQTIDTMLTEAEIIHLEDVSNLVRNLKNSAQVVLAFVLVFWLTCLVYKIRRQRYLWKPPSLFASVFGVVFIVATVGVGVIAIGPQRAFYFLHEVFFQGKGQWFFYFQESLMTTIMPEIVFANIAVLIAAVAMPIWLAAMITFRRTLE